MSLEVRLHQSRCFSAANMRALRHLGISWVNVHFTKVIESKKLRMIKSVSALLKQIVDKMSHRQMEIKFIDVMPGLHKLIGMTTETHLIKLQKVIMNVIWHLLNKIFKWKNIRYNPQDGLLTATFHWRNLVYIPMLEVNLQVQGLKLARMVVVLIVGVPMIRENLKEEHVLSVSSSKLTAKVNK